MNKVIHTILRLSIDPRVIVGLIGFTLSIVTHELLHVVMHLGEIDRIGIFPDRHAIVEIIFQPSTVYNLAVEEGIAYTVTMVTLILTAMLIGDINEMRDTRSVQQILFSKSTDNHSSSAHKKRSNDRLSLLLGVKPTARQTHSVSKKK